MAGFLGMFNYSKPGPGIGKDEPQKYRFFIFFEIFFRKFWKLIQINLLYFVSCIPFFIPFFYVLSLRVNNPILLALSLSPTIGIATVTSGFTYILRNFAREEHAFLWMDYRDTIKSNWRQSLVVGIVDFVVIFLMYFSLTFYYQHIKVNLIFAVPFIICVFLSIIFVFMQYYLFVMLITFDLRVKQLLKNALLFAFAGLGRNLLISLFSGIIILIIPLLFPYSLLLIPLIALSIIGLIINFNVWPLIDRIMIPKDTPEDKVENSVFDDNLEQRY